MNVRSENHGFWLTLVYNGCIITLNIQFLIKTVNNMVSMEMYELGAKSSVIREIFEY